MPASPMPSDEFPFGDPEHFTPAGLPIGATVLEYAKWANPDEDWQRCCVCGCAGNCSSYDRLSRGLLVLADGTLARAAWCWKLACADERYQSAYIAAEGSWVT